VLDQLGLADAIEWQAQDFASRTGLKLELDIGCFGTSPSGPIASAVFRMLQEALTNVAKHARASRVRVALGIEGEILSLDVTDDGRGISRDEMRGTHSLGLLGLRERAIALGGSVNVFSEGASGTTVSLRLPLPPAQAPANAETAET
jgi:signal transduction histidine kinase